MSGKLWSLFGLGYFFYLRSWQIYPLLNRFNIKNAKCEALSMQTIGRKVYDECAHCLDFFFFKLCLDIHNVIFYVGSSLTGVKTSWFKNSGRKSIPQLLLVLATTSSIDDIVAPSRVMRDRGVRIESVGIGSGFDGAQLKEIATHPARDHVMAISKFDLLPMIRPLLTFRMCRGKI